MAANPLLGKTNYLDPASLGSRLRAKRVGLFLELAEEVFRKHGSVRIIDIGGTPEYWQIVDRETIEKLKIHITIINIYKNISGLQPYMQYVQGDACEMHMFADKSFHLAHSNSVIEHVGSNENKIRFAKEVQRVAMQYYVQTPNFYFPVEPHFLMPFFHWLPLSLRVQLSMHFTMGHYTKTGSKEEAVTLLQHNAMLNKKELAKLFPHAKITTEKFLGLNKSLIAIG